MKFYKVALVILFLCSITALSGYFWHYHHIHQYDPMITRIASRYGLDPLLVKSLIYEESYFKKDARSNAGAVGLMQVTPITVKEWTRLTNQQDLNKAFPNISENRNIKTNSSDVEKLLTYPEINLQVGCWYLDNLMKRYSNLEDALPMVLASYNAGPSHAQRWQQLTYQKEKNRKNKYRELYLEQIDFPETKRYVNSVLVRYNKQKQTIEDSNTISWIFKQ